MSFFSLASLKKVDDYPMFRMTYHGDHGFDVFLETGAKNDEDIEAYVVKRLLKGLPIDLGITGDCCTSFVTHNHEGEMIFGRNFDFDYALSLQILTDPDDVHSSVSTVNLTFADYSADRIPEGGISAYTFLVNTIKREIRCLEQRRGDCAAG